VDIEALGISAGDTPIRVVIDPTVQTAVAAQPQVDEVQLPRTGAPLVATVMTGLVLAAGALLIRRKVR
jgi:LPXTG-motif cell wall-anchored protein